jgi:hypothetical protein
MFVANTVFESKGSKDSCMIRIDETYVSSFVLFPVTERLRSAILKFSELTAALPELMARKEGECTFLVHFTIWFSTLEENVIIN